MLKIIIVISIICVIISIIVISSITSSQNNVKGTVLSYYVEDIPYSHEPTTQKIIANTVNAWEKNNPMLKFKQVDDKMDSDIEIDWTKYIQKEQIGLTTMTEISSFWGLAKSYQYLVQIDILDIDCNNNEVRWNEDTITETLTHEFGHVLGLEHSSDKNNLMYDPDDGIENMPTNGYTIPEKVTNEGYYVGQKELSDQLQTKKNKIDDQNNELETYQNKIEQLLAQHGYTLNDLNNNLESYDVKFIDELNALIDKYNTLLQEANTVIDEYDLLVNKFNCFVESTNTEHTSPKVPKYTISKPQVSYKICTNGVCSEYLPPQ